MKATQEFSKYVSVPSNEGVRVDKSVVINRPVEEVYPFWQPVNKLPRFMRHLKSVTVRDDLHSHWVVEAFAGKTVEWDAEIIEQRKNEMISWRSTPGADVENAGSVWFTRLPGNASTAVRVELKYAPPAGKTGAYIARFFGYDVAVEIEEDLYRLKSLVETGSLPDVKSDLARRNRVADATGKAAWAANDIVRGNPWVAAGCIAAAFFALGFLLGAKRR